MRSPVAVGAAVQGGAVAPALVPSTESAGALADAPALESAEAVAAAVVVAPDEEATAAAVVAPPEPPSASSAVDEVAADEPEPAPLAAVDPVEEASGEGQTKESSPNP